MRIEHSTYIHKDGGKPLPRIDVRLAASEVAEHLLKWAQSPLDGNPTFFQQMQQPTFPDRDFATGGRPELTHEEAIAELGAMRSQYWDDKRKHALLQADFESVVKGTQYILSETGLFFDVARVIEGQPECWITETEQEQRRMVIRINYFVHWEVTTNQLFEAVEGIINTYKTLIKAGYQVKIEACYSGVPFVKHGKSKTHVGALFTHVDACGFNEFLDESTLTYLVCPTFYRLFLLSADSHFFINKGFNQTREDSKFMFDEPIQYNKGQIDFYGLVAGKKIGFSNLHHFTLENIQKVIQAGPKG